MLILVSDTSILIEFDAHNILKHLFKLPHEIVIPDLLYENELITLASCSKDNLLDWGLRVESLDADEMAIAEFFQMKAKGLSGPDCVALALAAKREWHLLSGDGLMRKFAEREKIPCNGTLWLLDRMLEESILTQEEYRLTLLALLNDPVCRLPSHLIEAKLSSEAPRGL
ncbi:hypothetical protein [Desulfovibrio sp. DV]|uniref:hypothetical protein n=1 Tax=Desulfovibrio sp. DV TaxID=1844708 RepID=UPI00094B9E61|nr:hypothetical protein [Desulfovibrio sp. DV]